MIPVRGYAGHKVAILGLGRSGLAAARALLVGGATPICWDDGAEGRARAEAEGFELVDLTRPGAYEGVAALIVSPGIPHLYPQPNRAIAAAWDAGIPVDNDIGLFFASLGTSDWMSFDQPPRVIAVATAMGSALGWARMKSLPPVSPTMRG